jgi:alkylhydroperoxidase family enzyme
MDQHEPLVRPLEAGEVDEDIREIFRINAEKGYQDSSFMQLLAHRPAILKAFIPLSKAFFFGQDSTVPHRTKELIRLKIAEINQCYF